METKIKIIVRDGIVESVLSDCILMQTNAEVIDVEKDFEDYNELKRYAEEIYDKPEYKEIPVTYANFVDIFP